MFTYCDFHLHFLVRNNSLETADLRKPVKQSELILRSSRRKPGSPSVTRASGEEQSEESARALCSNVSLPAGYSISGFYTKVKRALMEMAACGAVR